MEGWRLPCRGRPTEPQQQRPRFILGNREARLLGRETWACGNERLRSRVSPWCRLRVQDREGVQWWIVKPRERSVNHGSPAPASPASSCPAEAAREPQNRPPGCKGVLDRHCTCRRKRPPGLGLSPVRPCPHPDPTRLDPNRGTWAMGTTLRPEAAATRPPHDFQALPPPAGGPTCAGR